MTRSNRLAYEVHLDATAPGVLQRDGEAGTSFLDLPESISDLGAEAHIDEDSSNSSVGSSSTS